MSDAPFNSAGWAQGTPHQGAPASFQDPTIYADQLGNFPQFTNQNDFMPGGNLQNAPSVHPIFPQFGNQQPQFSQLFQNVPAMSGNPHAGWQAMNNSSSAPQNANTTSATSEVPGLMVNQTTAGSSSSPENVNATLTTPLVVSSQQCRQPQKAKQTPAATPLVGNSQAQQTMVNSSPALQSNSTASTTPLVVSSQQCRQPQKANQAPSATPMMANFGAENPFPNQASMSQPFMGNNQAQYMQNVQNPMVMNNMHMAGGMQPSFGGMQPSVMGNGQPYPMGNFQPNFMGNPQAQFNNNFAAGSPPNPFMGFGQPQPQFMANPVFGQNAANNMFLPHGVPMDIESMQTPSQAQGFQNQTLPQGLSPTATPFVPAQVGVGLQQRVSPQVNMAPQTQMTPGAFPNAQAWAQQAQMSRVHQASPMAHMGMVSMPQPSQMNQMALQQRIPQMAQMAMQQQSPQTQQAAKKGTQKRAPKRSRTDQLGPDTSKRRKTPADNVLMLNRNGVANSSPLSRLQNRFYEAATATHPRNIKHMEMKPNPQPQHVLGQYLTNPEQHPITTSSTQQPMQQPTQQPLQLPASSRVSSIDQLSHQLGSEEDHQTFPSTQAQLSLPVQRPTIPEGAGEPTLSKKEKWLRQAEAQGKSIAPSQRRLIRFERDDPRLERDENGEPITPEADMYNVYFVAPDTEIPQEVIDRLIRGFQKDKEAKEAAGNNNAASTSTSNKAKNKTTKSKSKSKAQAKPNTKQGNTTNSEGKLIMKPAEKITVHKRRQSKSTAPTTIANTSEADATNSIIVPDATTHNSNAVVAQPNSGTQLAFPNTAPNSSGVVAQPNSNNDFTSPASAPFPFENFPQTVIEVGDAAELSTASDSNLTQTSSVQGELASPPVSQSTEATTASFETPVDPALIELPEAQQDQQMRQVSHDLSQDLLQQTLTAFLDDADEFLFQSLTENLALDEFCTASATTAPDSSPDNQCGDMSSSFINADTVDTSVNVDTVSPGSEELPSSHMSFSDEPGYGLFDTDPTDPINQLMIDPALHFENEFASGNNDVSVMTVQFSNAPSTRLTDMNHSPAPSSTQPLSDPYHPPSNPSFEPRDPHNTVLGQYASPSVD